MKNASRLRVGWVVSLAVLIVGGAARAQVVSESLGDGITRYFASADARERALPSYALKEEIKGKGGAPGAVVPQFVIGKDGLTVTLEIKPGTSLYGRGAVSGPLLRNGGEA